MEGGDIGQSLEISCVLFGSQISILRALIVIFLFSFVHFRAFKIFPGPTDHYYKIPHYIRLRNESMGTANDCGSKLIL